jgi:peptidyl-prolyl cis-trans isomerase C
MLRTVKLFHGYCRQIKIAFLLLMFSATVIAQQEDNPIVMQSDTIEVRKNEFDADFWVALRMLAAQQGIALGNQSDEVITRLRTQYLTQRGGELVLVEEAERRGLTASDAAVIAQAGEMREKINADTSVSEPLDQATLLKIVRDKQLVQALSEDLLDEIVVRPGDVVVMHHDMQEDLRRPEQICIRHILVEDESLANEIFSRLNDGADFAAMAAEYSIDPKTADNGGDMGCFEKEGNFTRSEFERVAFDSEVDELTGPVGSEFGFHVLVVYERRPSYIPTLTQVFDELEQEIRHERLPEKLMEVQEANQIELFPDRL